MVWKRSTSATATGDTLEIRGSGGDGQLTVLAALTCAGNRSSLASVESDARFGLVHDDIGTPGLAELLLREQRIDTFCIMRPSRMWSGRSAVRMRS